ncbi:uncharacterized protein BJ212DRAFT_1310723 [Suillus subaureus]|uniref:Uncharacterized protein n=1 Tax=Suillus subaureus TaxID=48587 RepID=A0A9P7EQ44_9AGAM|nr:uncharacterized protein BJ212DRAFT_1310723 [Suillus subaureus]KAG1827180.1 hypothetical protein BJ212DRAFT_1310723 [Suillus subaureus]
MIATSPEVCPSGSYEPTTADILMVKKYFKLFSISLPDELIDDIIDAASYWAHTSLTVNGHIVACADGDKMYMRTLPLAVYGTEGDFLLDKENLQGEGFVLGGLPPTELEWAAPTRAKPFRKIEFQLWSHDQGWGGELGCRGTYNGAYSWFDASVERLHSTSCFTGSIEWPSSFLFTAVDALNLPDDVTFIQKDVKRPFLPSPSTLQKNIVAEGRTTHHIITWTDLDDVKESSPEAIAAENRGQGWKSYDGSFVRDLQVGDCITLWMRARFPGWSNDAVKAKITAFWAV